MNETQPTVVGDQRTALTHAEWLDANQRYLTRELAKVRGRLERRIGDGSQPYATSDQPPADGEQLSPPPALETLCAVFGLSSFERDVLLLCAGAELDSSFTALYASAQGNLNRTSPTFSLALAALPDAHWGALNPSAALRHWRMIEVGAGNTITQAPLRVDERILHYLTGVQHLDERLVGMVEAVGSQQSAVSGPLVPSHQALVERIVAAWRHVPETEDMPVVHLCGSDAATRREIAAAAVAAIGLRLYALLVHAVPLVPAELETVVRLWEREAALSGAALLVESDQVDPSDAARKGATTRLIQQIRGILLVGGQERWQTPLRTTVVFDICRPLPGEQRNIWLSLLGAEAAAMNGHVDALVAQFDLSASGIRAAWADSVSEQEAVSSEQDTNVHRSEVGGNGSVADVHRSSFIVHRSDLLWSSCRRQARPRLDDLAQRIEPVATWEQLVLPPSQLQALHEIAVHVRQRAKVYETWGFSAQSKRGLGISVLFAGSSGTGKTMAAEVLANELKLDLYRIDLSAVVSKYIGETEKNLRRVFDAAEEGGAILLFDEADALFGKRSEVKDSHDRYANIEVSYLLQRMEAYRGLAILTTNMKQALDTAFMRRIRFVVQFPFPDAAQRAEIWRRIFPSQTPTEGMDVAKLARLNIAGGNIRNIALYAAFLAAEDNEPVRMSHLLRASRAEYAKLERPLTESEIGGWL